MGPAVFYLFSIVHSGENNGGLEEGPVRNYAFKNTTSLTTINLEAAEAIREGAFYGCSGLENVTFAEGVTIEDWAFFKTPVVLP